MLEFTVGRPFPMQLPRTTSDGVVTAIDSRVGEIHMIHLFNPIDRAFARDFEDEPVIVVPIEDGPILWFACDLGGTFGTSPYSMGLESTETRALIRSGLTRTSDLQLYCAMHLVDRHSGELAAHRRIPFSDHASRLIRKTLMKMPVETANLAQRVERFHEQVPTIAEALLHPMGLCIELYPSKDGRPPPIFAPMIRDFEMGTP